MMQVTNGILRAAESAYTAAAREMDPRPMRPALEAAFKMALPQPANCANCGARITDYAGAQTNGLGKYFCDDKCFITFKGEYA